MRSLFITWTTSEAWGFFWVFSFNNTIIWLNGRACILSCLVALFNFWYTPLSYLEYAQMKYRWNVPSLCWHLANGSVVLQHLVAQKTNGEVLLCRTLNRNIRSDGEYLGKSTVAGIFDLNILVLIFLYIIIFFLCVIFLLTV